MTPHGWNRLDELAPGDRVVVNVGKARTRPRVKHRYQRVGGLTHHPHRSGRENATGAGTVLLHRLVVEAAMNNLTFEEFIDRCRNNVEGLCFLHPNEWIVHHRDHDPANNRLENLEVLSRSEHAQLHADHGNYRNVLQRVGDDFVEALEAHTPEATFSLAVGRGRDNVVVAGIVVRARPTRGTEMSPWSGLVR